MNQFLPVTKEEMLSRGWKQPDFVYVIGDAYVDHSSFGPAIISRVLESRGYKVAIISQPDWKDENSITTFGEPKYAFLISSGNMDSMVNHYSVNKKRRQYDYYTPGGVIGKRPDYATYVYCNLIKKKYKKVPVIIGGIEASLRRLAHYDYWSDKMKKSILMDSGADLLLYGMGEHSIVEVADALSSGLDIKDITFIRGTCYKTSDVSNVVDGIMLPEYDELIEDKINYAKSFDIQYRNTDFASAKPLIEKYADKRYIVQNPPSLPLTQQEFDDVYELPYMNDYHPSYKALGGVPAISEIKFSLTSCRGCFGGCSFCALTFHQGRIVQSRSHESLIREAQNMTKDPDFKGYIHDVGGPTANFRKPACKKQMEKGACTNKQCLFPEPCKNLEVDHKDYISLLRKLRAIPKVKKVFIRSGIRFDYVLADKNDDFLRELCQYHVSGQLRVAPEHITDHVLELMGKPKKAVYDEFCTKFEKINKQLGLDQYLVPYLISSHPGSNLKDAIALAESIRDMGYMPEQVQDFYPTPSTISTVMYYAGVDPRTMKKVEIVSNPHEKAMQRALMQYRKPENYDLVKEALLKEGREDLIGFNPKLHLIPPRKLSSVKMQEGHNKNSKPGNPKSDNTKLGNSKSEKNKTGNTVSKSGIKNNNKSSKNNNNKNNNKSNGKTRLNSYNKPENNKKSKKS
ncbi:MAG: YgiQ family radical SAM protein [Lachnospiraceae bacterium]|nr:YgiQ family radical SAM protein [Lachnospiraceae bacterium]